MSIQDLPAVNAALNAVATVLIVTALVLIKQGKEQAHKRMMLAALGTSAVFLASYVTHKIFGGVHTPFPEKYGQGIRIAYLIMLALHVVLAAAMLPLILLAVRAAFRDQRARHKKLVKWATPIWLYVSVTGVLIYFCIYQWFPA